jgi:hypothetical protein
MAERCTAGQSLLVVDGAARQKDDARQATHLLGARGRDHSVDARSLRLAIKAISFRQGEVPPPA